MRRMAASPAAPIPAHRPAHFRRHDCRRHCRRTRRPAWHGASHRCPRSCRPGRPLNRRAAPLRRVPRRRFPDPPFSANQASDPPGRALGLTPDASLMQRVHARPEPAFLTPWGDIGHLPASLSCRIERVSVRYTRFLMGPACPCRSVSPTDTRSDTRASRGISRGWRPLSATDTRAPCAGFLGLPSRSRSGRAPASLSRRRPGGAIPGHARASATSLSRSSPRPSRTIASRLSVARNRVQRKRCEPPTFRPCCC